MGTRNARAALTALLLLSLTAALCVSLLSLAPAAGALRQPPAASAAPPTSSSASAAAAEPTVRLLVRAPEGASAAELAAALEGGGRGGRKGRGLPSLAAALGARSGDVRVRRVLESSGLVAIEVPLSLETSLAAAGYRVERDRPVHALLPESVPLVNATQVWAFLDSAGLNVTGVGVTIAVIDTGIDYTHPDLGGCTNTTHLAGNCKVLPGYDYKNDDADAMDDHWHGTHAAGIAAANGTLRGVAPDATLVAYKVLDENGDGFMSDLVAAIENASAAGYDVISLSLGGLGTAGSIESAAIGAAVAAGSVVVVAAGNSGPGGNTACRSLSGGASFSVCSPGVAPLALTVGNSDKSDILAGSSSRGPSYYYFDLKPDITAPGENINSTLPGGDYGLSSGTSMAAPHVSGAAALVRQLHPSWSALQVRASLIGSSRDLGYNVTDQGAGRLDALAAVNATFVAEPATLSLRSRFNPLNNVTVQFNLTDLSNSTYNVSLSASLRQSSGSGVPVLNASIVELPALGSAGITLSFENLTESSTGTYSGFVTANTSLTRIRVPFWVRLNECGAVTGNVMLTRDLNITGMNCLFIGADNLVVDGNGSTITGDGTDAYYGIDNTDGFDNVTIRDFGLIEEFGFGIYTVGMDNSTIVNNTVRPANVSGGLGIEIESSRDVLVTLNNVTSDGSPGEGIGVTTSDGVNVTSNTIATSGESNYGIWLYTSHNSTVAGNTITLTGNLTAGIFLDAGSLANNFSSNTVVSSGQGSPGIQADMGSSSNAFSANSVLTSGAGGYGVLISADSGLNSFLGDAVNATSAEELYVSNDTAAFTGVLLLGTVNLTSHSLSEVSLDVNTTPPADPAGKHNISDYLTIANTSSGAYINFNLSYTDDEVSAFPESTLLMHRHNGSAWASLTGSSVDTASDTVRSGNITSFGTFAPLGESPASCGVITASATLMGNLTSSGTCFTINASNIVLDGNGYAITGEGSGYGVFANGTTYLTVRNFAGIDNFSVGVYAESAHNSTLTNNTIVMANETSPTPLGIYLYRTTDATVSANTITALAAGSVGIDVEASNGNNTVTSNTLSISGSSSIGLFADYSSDHTFSLNAITASGDGAWGIWMESASPSTLSSNTVTMSGAEGGAVRLHITFGSTISANTLVTSGAASHALMLNDSGRNSILSNSLNATSAPEIYANVDSQNNSITSALLMGATNLTSHSFTGVSIDVNTTPPADPAGKRNLSDYVTIANTSASSFIDFNLSYTAAEAADVDAGSLRIHRHDGGSWQELSSSDVDAAGITVRSGNVTSFGTFAAFGNDSLPQWSSAWNGTPATFNASALLRFNITWTDNTEVSSVVFEVNRSGTVLGYNGSNMSASAWNLTLADFPAGTHYWRSTATDTMGSSNTSPWFGFSIARESPSLSLTLNGSAGGIAIDENSSVWLNASVSQGDSAYTLEIAVDGSSKGKNASGPHANLTAFTTTGIYNISANYSETQNYSFLTVSYPLTVDDTMPPEVLSHSPTGTIATSSTTLSAATNENSTCRFSTSSGIAYENMSGEMSGNATNHTASLSELADGTHHRYIRCNNTNGRVATADYDATFTVSIPATPPSGGGGGGGGAPVATAASNVPSATRVFGLVTPAEAASATLSKEGVPVTGIELAVTSVASNVQLTVAAHSSLPEDAPVEPRSPSGAALPVYSYLDITHTNLEGKLREAWLTFRVNRSWLAENSADKADVVLMRYTPRGWDELATSITDESLTHVTYTARTPSFSVFAIAVRTQAAQPAAAGQQNATAPQHGEEPTGEAVSDAGQSPGLPPARSVRWGRLAGLAAVALVALIALSLMGRRAGRSAQGAAKAAPPRMERPAADLRIYISKYRREGRSEEEIRGELVKAGWSAEAIDGAFGSRRSLEPRRDLSLLLYIQGCRRKGFTDDDIRRSLISGGWDEDTVLDALKAAPRARKARAKTA